MRVEIGQKLEFASQDLIFASTDGVAKHHTSDQIVKLATEGSFDERMQGIFDQVVKKSEKYLEDDNTVILFKYST